MNAAPVLWECGNCVPRAGKRKAVNGVLVRDHVKAGFWFVWEKVVVGRRTWWLCLGKPLVGLTRMLLAGFALALGKGGWDNDSASKIFVHHDYSDERERGKNSRNAAVIQIVPATPVVDLWPSAFLKPELFVLERHPNKNAATPKSHARVGRGGRPISCTRKRRKGESQITSYPLAELVKIEGEAVLCTVKEDQRGNEQHRKSWDDWSSQTRNPRVAVLVRYPSQGTSCT
ncbi:hypothetical protein QBC43DRAFT_336249 [Cladorrhinum sp. PSN259]|nr:hypothetical protein QBC43DRAFT_336249 [Cladorrhinum sp. PSN259]